VLGPVVVVAALFALVVGQRLETTYYGNATGFVLFGRLFARYTRPPSSAVIRSPIGYDGQFFYLQATDPLLLRDSTLAGFVNTDQPFRMQRMAYPALAYLLAAGQRSRLPESLLAVNLLAVAAVTAGFATYAHRRGWSGWWGLAVGLMAGLLTGTLRDLSDPLAIASVLAGLILWRERRRAWAALLLSVAVLAREPMLLAVAAIAIDAAMRWWRARGTPSAGSRILREAWPVVAIPVAAFLIWQVYIDLRFGGNAASASSAFKPPFVNVLDEVRHALDDPAGVDSVWDLAYLTLMVSGIAAAAALVRDRVTSSGLAALMFGLTLLVLVFGDPWSYTRLSAPMLAALLLAGLEQHNRPALAICAAAAALTVMLPLVPWFGAA
jgi:hypothetical protein